MEIAQPYASHLLRVTIRILSHYRVTDPVWQPGRDEHEQYREHVIASLAASPWARVIKASDFTDNAVGIIHTTGPRLSKLARKYSSS